MEDLKRNGRLTDLGGSFFCTVDPDCFLWNTGKFINVSII